MAVKQILQLTAVNAQLNQTFQSLLLSLKDVRAQLHLSFGYLSPSVANQVHLKDLLFRIQSEYHITVSEGFIALLLLFRARYTYQKRYDIALRAITPTQVESRLHSLYQAAGGIDVHVNANKTEYSDISTLNDGYLTLVVKFTYLGSSVSSIENYINSRLPMAWTVINIHSVI